MNRRRYSCSRINLHKLFFVLSLTVEKAQVGRKIALASVHRLDEHLHVEDKITVKPGQAYLPRSFNVFIIRN